MYKPNPLTGMIMNNELLKGNDLVQFAMLIDAIPKKTKDSIIGPIAVNLRMSKTEVKELFERATERTVWAERIFGNVPNR